MASRRTFLGRCTAVTLALVAGARPAWARARRARFDGHPTPRPGITAARLPTKEQLADAPRAQPVFDSVREIPEIIDGIRCHCGCADNPDFYSLLSCYEGVDAMARACPICQGQGRLAARLHGEGKTLDEIRSAIDARFG
ncbi:MAG TPA: twin-arginine translocation signal domain-containing protein [Gemmatimonadales bacterium]|nr:twin-arginine translocation signal domain-containing protein [Gemmatimonadales bacterium]